jgi:hypothetical protein
MPNQYANEPLPPPPSQQNDAYQNSLSAENDGFANPPVEAPFAESPNPNYGYGEGDPEVTPPPAPAPDEYVPPPIDDDL